MIYNICNAPLQSELWCFGFLFDENRVVVDCPPINGRLVSTSYRNARFKTEEGAIDLTKYTTHYRFAETNDDAIACYNKMIADARGELAAIDRELASLVIK